MSVRESVEKFSPRIFSVSEAQTTDTSIGGSLFSEPENRPVCRKETPLEVQQLCSVHACYGGRATGQKQRDPRINGITLFSQRLLHGKCRIIAEFAHYTTISRSACTNLQKNGQQSATLMTSTVISTGRTPMSIFERSHIGLWIAWSRHTLDFFRFSQIFNAMHE